MKKITIYIDAINYNFWDSIKKSTVIEQESLSIYRIFFGVYCLIFSTISFSWLDSTPDAYFNPPLLSIAYLFDGFIDFNIFHIFDLIVLIALLSITIGYRTRLATALLFIVKIIGYNFTFSFGKIDHNILENVLLLSMIVANWGKYYALRPDVDIVDKPVSKGLSILAICIAFGYFSAGIIKLLFWIDFDPTTSGILNWYYITYYNYGHTALLAPYMDYLPIYILEIIEYIVVLFEISGFIFLLKGKKYWNIYLLLASFFHFSNTLLINIPFQEHIIVFISFISFNSLFFFKNFVNIKSIIYLSVLLFLFNIFKILNSTQSIYLFYFNNNPPIQLVASISAALWTCVLILFSIQLNIIRKDK